MKNNNKQQIDPRGIPHEVPEAPADIANQNGNSLAASCQLFRLRLWLSQFSVFTLSHKLNSSAIGKTTLSSCLFST